MNMNRDSGMNMSTNMIANNEQPLTTLSPSIKQEIHDQLVNLHQQENYVDKDKDENVDKDKKPPRNPYYLFGMICLLVCFIILSYRVLGKKK